MSQKITLGIPRERKMLEKRVAVTPDGAADLVKLGATVVVEENAGLGSHFTNEQYTQAGCELTNSLEKIWSSNVIVKVKEPHEEEYKHFKAGSLLFDYLHLASMPDVAKALLEAKVTSVGYELVQTAEKRLPLLEPMSEVAGKLSIVLGSYHLLSQKGGRGILTGGVVGVLPAKVVIVGGGIAGRNACEVAMGMGADVTIIDISWAKLDQIKRMYQGRVKTLHSTKGSISRALLDADLVIGSVLIPGAAAPKIITEDMVKSMQKGSVIVDISIDQGGCVETIRPTSLDEPVYEKHGVIHYGVCNMPAQTPRTSTLALTAATLPYIMKIVKGGGVDGVMNDLELRNAINTHNGKLTNKAVSEAIGIAYSEL